MHTGKDWTKVSKWPAQPGGEPRGASNSLARRAGGRGCGCGRIAGDLPPLRRRARPSTWSEGSGGKTPWPKECVKICNGRTSRKQQQRGRTRARAVSKPGSRPQCRRPWLNHVPPTMTLTTALATTPTTTPPGLQRRLQRNDFEPSTDR